MYLWNSKYLRSTTDTSMTECDKIITVMDIVSTRKKNTIAANVTGTASINCHSKNVRYCYILHTVLSVNILLLIILLFAVIMQNKKVQYKMEINELEKSLY